MKNLIICLSHELNLKKAFSSDYLKRIKKAFELYSKKKNSVIYFTGGLVYSDLQYPISAKAKKYTIRFLGVKEEDIITDQESKDTVSEIIYLNKILEKFQPQNLSLITSDWHIQRVKEIVKKIYDEKYIFKYYTIKGYKKGWLIENKNNSLLKFIEWSKNIKPNDINKFKKILLKKHDLYK